MDKQYELKIHVGWVTSPVSLREQAQPGVAWASRLKRILMYHGVGPVPLINVIE
jgi:hypothetical protein